MSSHSWTAAEILNKNLTYFPTFLSPFKPPKISSTDKTGTTLQDTGLTTHHCPCVRLWLNCCWRLWRWFWWAFRGGGGSVCGLLGGATWLTHTRLLRCTIRFLSKREYRTVKSYLMTLWSGIITRHFYLIKMISSKDLFPEKERIKSSQLWKIKSYLMNLWSRIIPQNFTLAKLLLPDLCFIRIILQN